LKKKLFHITFIKRETAIYLRKKVKPIRILIVEDERITAEDIKRSLEKAGYEIVAIASTAREAIGKVEKLHPDLVLMDIILQGKGDGIEAAERITGVLGVPVVYLTAFSDAEIIRRMRESRPYGYILKPYEEGELYSNIEIALERSRFERKLTHLNTILLALRQVDEILFSGTDEIQMIQSICDRLAAHETYAYAWFLLFNDCRQPRLYAERGMGKPCREAVEKWKDGRFPQSIDYLLTHAKSMVIRKEDEINSICDLGDESRDRGAYIGRIAYEKRVFGLLFVTLPIDFIDEEREQSLFINLLNNIALSLHNRELAREKEQKEELLRENERKWYLFFENMPGASFIVDERLRIIDVNAALCSLTRYAREDLIGEPRGKICPDEVKHFQVYLSEKEKVDQEESHLLASDGTLVPVIKSSRRIHIGERDMIMETAHDISERKKMEQILRQNQKLEALGKLAGGIAHDFNNILTVISGYTSVIIDSLPSRNPLRSDLLEIKRAEEKAARLTGQLLAFSRQQVMQPKVLDLNFIVSDMSRFLRRMIGEDIRLVSRLEPELRHVRLDPSQVEQVLVNLAINARDAMIHGGRLQIETRNTQLRPQLQIGGSDLADFVQLTVRDTGIGMTREISERIFEPFFTTKEKGTGLGLSTVYGIIRQSGGHILVNSEPGKGTTFEIYFPATREELPPPESDKELLAELKGNEVILVVEDEEDVRQMIVRYMKRFGYRILQAADGKKALQIVSRRKDPIHLLLTDVLLPQVSGENLAEQVRALQSGIKVLYMSGYSPDAVIFRGILQPGIHFISKPFSPRDLLKTIREILDGQ